MFGKSKPEVKISLEFTPNPNTLKFVLDQTFLERGAANFTDKAKAASASPLAKRLFDVPGVGAVMIGTNFVTITRGPDGTWDVLSEEVPKTLQAHFKSGEKALSDAWHEEQKAKAADPASSVIETKIREILDKEIRPAVAMDGGDIQFDRFDNGVVYLHLQGACSSCPSSIATLKMGVETRLREAIPEVSEVVQI